MQMRKNTQAIWMGIFARLYLQMSSSEGSHKFFLLK